MTIADLQDADRQWACGILKERWAGPMIERLGFLVDASTAPALIAWLGGERCGLLTYLTGPYGFEILTLDSLQEGRGVGSALMSAAEARARELRMPRIFLLTTNDNMHALAFYQRRGYRLVAVHRDSMTTARQIKPEIPLVGLGGIPLLDEIELERILQP